MIDIDNLNINLHGKPVAGFTGSNDLFNEVEALIGGTLPEEYISFIRAADGGHPEVGSFLVSEPDNFIEVDWFYSLGNPDMESIRTAIQSWRSLLGPQALPIGRDGGDNQIYLLLGTDNPSVWLYLHDESGARVRLANSLGEFLSGLVLNPDLI